LSDDVVGNAVAARAPSRWDLTSDKAVERDGLGHENARAFLELDEPLAALGCPDVALVAMLVLELLCLGVRDLKRLEVMSKLDLLVEGLLLRIVAAEELWF
jgi:hypothetical protein